MTKRYLELRPEHSDFIEKRQQKESSKVTLDENQMFIAEFGFYYGWGGVQAILSDSIELSTAVWLLEAARRLENKYIYNIALGNYIGSGSVNSANPPETFKKLTDSLREELK